MPYGYSWGMAGQTRGRACGTTIKSAPSSRAPPTRVYALIKGFGTFYCSVLEKCRAGGRQAQDGPELLPGSSVSYNEFNVCYDISFVTAGLRIAREAATLKKDTALLKPASTRSLPQVPDVWHAA